MYSRCTQIRTIDGTKEFTPKLKLDMLKKVGEYADQDCLRVLAFATVDAPVIPQVIKATNFIQYEVFT